MQTRSHWLNAFPHGTGGQRMAEPFSSSFCYCYWQAWQQRIFFPLKIIPGATHQLCGCGELVAIGPGQASYFPDQTTWQAINSMVPRMVSWFPTFPLSRNWLMQNCSGNQSWRPLVEPVPVLMQHPACVQDRAAHHGNNNKKLMIQVEKYMDRDR